CARGGNDVW
nr:immunoglobulin heavy chain junction region [Mus musculus]